jgi:hypothetical protein
LGLLAVAVLMAPGKGSSQETQVAAAPSTTRVTPAAKPVPGRYIVVLKKGEELAQPVDVDAEADSVALGYNALIGARWKHALLGFVADMTRAWGTARMSLGSSAGAPTVWPRT